MNKSPPDEHYSFSRIEVFNKCPYAYKLKYLDGWQCYPSTDADDARIIGTAMHNGIRYGVDAAIADYMKHFFIASDASENECLKLAQTIPKAQQLLATELKLDEATATFEYEINCEGFLGFIDLVVQRPNGSVELYDFKHSNNAESYQQSPQIHVYQYFYQKLNPDANVTKLGYIMIPKVNIRQKKTEDIYDFRKRLAENLDAVKPYIITVPYSLDKVNEFFAARDEATSAKDFPKTQNKLCTWCEYSKYCKDKATYMILPKNERRAITTNTRKKVWIYGTPFSGKTTLANQFPNPIFLNTDGNINSFDAPYILIKDMFEGPMVKQYGWEVFFDAVKTLAAGNHPYQTIVIDLLEDIYEFCRVWTYKKLGITHESEKTFVAWDMVRTNFLNEIKRLSSLPVNLVLISHEDRSRDLTQKTGDKVTSISPNLSDKLANKVAGMVDLVIRVTCENDKHFINLKADEVVFGGGRLHINAQRLPCMFDQIELLYQQSMAKPVIPQAMPVGLK